MRLALVYHQMIGRGGLERYVLSLARALGERGHEIRMITALTDDEVEAMGLEITRIGLAGVPRWCRLAVFARRAAREPVRSGEVVLGFGRTWRQDIHRAGGGCHALYSRLLPRWRRWGAKNQVELALERRLYRGGETGRFVVNAAPVAAQLQQVHGVPAEKITVIHTAVDSARYAPGVVAESAAVTPAAGRPVFLFVSSNHRRKGLPGLVHALSGVPAAEVWVVGGPLRRADRRLVTAAGVADRVRSIGEVVDLVPLYRQATWFVHPTLYDACANTVLQSMACGLPGLISRADGASEFIRDGVNGLLLTRPDDPEHLAAMLRRALSIGPAERSALGQAARETVAPLTWPAHVAQWESLCQRVLEERKQGACRS